MPEQMLEAICGTALALGVDSLRASLFAERIARAAAALAGRDRSRWRTSAPPPGWCWRRAPPASRCPISPRTSSRRSRRPRKRTRTTTRTTRRPSRRSTSRWKTWCWRPPRPPSRTTCWPCSRWAPCAALEHQRQVRRQPERLPARRPAGTRRGEPGAGAKLASSRPCAPPRPGSACGATSASSGAGARRAGGGAPDDFRVTRYKQRSETTTIFVVDASGSAALHRLAEAKGAVELLLADCYVRRDRVAMIAFRGPGAELLLPPTRSLVRAKRSLAGLPGGGGTPLASASTRYLAETAPLGQQPRRGTGRALRTLAQRRCRAAAGCRAAGFGLNS
jgi:magnesium chelatase subunit D